jgi:1-aminocyclopropane-1-carboxylate deaminase
MFFYQNPFDSPLQRIEDERLEAHQIRLFIKRDDLLHPFPKESGFLASTVSGNKFRKIKYNAIEMQRLGKSGMITFGGAFSNHIHAAAAAGQLLGIPTIGIIRGERPAVLNTTLTFAETCGMTLHFISRSAYRDKNLVFKELENQYPNYYWLPEGGTNNFALKGASEIVPEIITQLDAQPDYICLACGTGGTTAGIISAAATLPKPINVLSFSALKGDFLEKDVFQLLNGLNTEGALFEPNTHWSIQNNYHFGGYAKWTLALVDFINDFKTKHGIPLDPIYTGKMLFGVFDLIEKGAFKKNTTIVAVHTGGLQGIDGFNTRFGNLIV